MVLYLLKVDDFLKENAQNAHCISFSAIVSQSNRDPILVPNFSNESVMMLWHFKKERMSEASRGGRSWFAVESKSFELLGRKLRGCIWERYRGITSQIRLGEVSLSWLLDGVEACCRDNGNRRWVLD